ncbi:keratin-associated protein 12-1, partial [Daubentonia madagascariensis]
MCHTSCSSGCQPAGCVPSPCQATCYVPVSCQSSVCVPLSCRPAVCLAPLRPVLHVCARELQARRVPGPPPASPPGAASPPALPSSADLSPAAPLPAA